MEIYLIRHTKPQVDVGTCYGQSDMPLASSFENEFNIIKEKIPSSFDAVFCSPLKRCAKLAERLNSEKIIYNDSLKELNFGKWELKKWNDIENGELKEWTDNYINIAPPDGETYQQLFKRVKNFWDEEIVPLKKGKIAVVAHAGVIRAILANILELKLQKTFSLSIDYGSITKVELNDNYYLVKYING